MKQLKIQIRLYIAEKLLFFASTIAPSNDSQGIAIKTIVEAYARQAIKPTKPQKPEKDTFKSDINERIYQSEDEGLDELIEAYEKKAHEGLIVLAFTIGAAIYGAIHHFIIH